MQLGTLEIVYHYDNGTEEVRWRRPANTIEALRLQQQVIRAGYSCPYSWRIVDDPE